jgi:phenylacetate-coenzyme A ligase PaaK-like adenylate-forming protein
MVISSSDSVAKLRRNILLPIYWNYIRRLNTLKYYEKLRKLQWSTMEENREIQRKKLYELIKYASKNIPYYRKVINKYDIQFSEHLLS